MALSLVMHSCRNNTAKKKHTRTHKEITQLNFRLGIRGGVCVWGLLRSRIETGNNLLVEQASRKKREREREREKQKHIQR